MSEIPDEDTPIYAQMMKESAAKERYDAYDAYFSPENEEEAAHE